MLVYRLSKTSYAGDLEGAGAKLFGGRWNVKGTACIYTSASRALAVLEFASNVELEFIPEDLSITVYEVPEEAFHEVKTKDLPVDWREIPSPQSTKEFGSKLFEQPDLLGMRVPSVVVVEEFNYLINPDSNKIKSVEVIEIRKFEFDHRIKR